MSEIFNYIALKDSIKESEDFSYLTNMNEWKGLTHMLDIIIDKKVKDNLIKEIFSNRINNHILSQEIDYFEKESGRNVKQLNPKLIDRYIQSKRPPNRKIIFCRSEKYNNFSSFLPGEEIKDSKNRNHTLLYNISLLEKTGSIGIIPSNANILLSSLLYSYALLVGDSITPGDSQLSALAKIFNTLFMSMFGRQHGLLTAERKQKEMFFLSVSTFIYSTYSIKKSKQELLYFLRSVSGIYGIIYLADFLNAMSAISFPTNIHDSLDTNNFNTLPKLLYALDKSGIMSMDINSMIVKMFKVLGVYGVMAFSNYQRLVAYFLATSFPNTYFSTVLKIYNAESYEQLVKQYSKLVYSAKWR